LAQDAEPALDEPAWTIATPEFTPISEPVSEPPAEDMYRKPFWSGEVPAVEEQAPESELVAETPAGVAETPSWAYTSEPVAETPVVEPETPAWSFSSEPAETSDDNTPAWPTSEPVAETPAVEVETPAWSFNQPEASAEEPAAEQIDVPIWRDLPSTPDEPAIETWTPNETSEPVAAEQAAPEPVVETSSWSTPEPEVPASEPVASEEPAPAAAGADATLFGRVQVNIAPVPDFDRLLSLDSALSRIGAVQSVTLADYAQEEVTFRIDLASPLAASDFAQELSEAAGMPAAVDAADEGAVSLRLS
jgi:hypothetical protein